MSAVRTVEAADLEDIRRLFRAYADFLKADHGHDLYAEGFDAELAALPGNYAGPKGALLLGRGADGAALGCIALRDLGGGTGEVKRLFVAPEARGQALGRALVGGVLARARALGYARVVLDSLPTLHASHSLYRSLGFADIAPYHGNTALVFMGRAL
jgi:GNAT superfamily N-acetyltransferase